MPHSNNWFSNFLPYDQPLILEGISYKTPEHFYQAMKTTDPEIQQAIADCKTPREAKKLGQSVALREHWEDMKMDIMRQAQIHRYRLNSPMLKKLLESKGELVEWNTWHDNEWGQCLCQKCKGKGKNKLGKILMEIRERHWDKLRIR
jgi:ribA/ribD-fused uncharacterized protein